MLEVLKALLLALHFFYYTLMTFLMMLSVILLSMLMILIHETLWTGAENRLADFNAGKTPLILFDRSCNTGAIDVKMDRSVLGEKSSFKML